MNIINTIQVSPTQLTAWFRKNGNSFGYFRTKYNSHKFVRTKYNCQIRTISNCSIRKKYNYLMRTKGTFPFRASIMLMLVILAVWYLLNDDIFNDAPILWVRYHFKVNDDFNYEQPKKFGWITTWQKMVCRIKYNSFNIFGLSTTPINPVGLIPTMVSD